MEAMVGAEVVADDIRNCGWCESLRSDRNRSLQTILVPYGTVGSRPVGPASDDPRAVRSWISATHGAGPPLDLRHLPAGQVSSSPKNLRLRASTLPLQWQLDLLLQH